MYLEEVEFINWRNLEKVELSFPEKTLVLAGDNAQGKTNFWRLCFFWPGEHLLAGQKMRK